MAVSYKFLYTKPEIQCKKGMYFSLGGGGGGWGVFAWQNLLSVAKVISQQSCVPRIKNGVYDVINLNDKQSKGTYWVSLFIVRDTAVYIFFWDWVYSSRSIKQDQRKMYHTQHLA